MSTEICSGEQFRRWKNGTVREFDVYDSEQVKMLLGVSDPEIKKLRESGLNAQRVGSSYRFSGKVIIEYIDELLGAS